VTAPTPRKKPKAKAKEAVPDTKKTIAAAMTLAEARLLQAALEAFTARADAMAVILQDAPPNDVLLLCVRALAEVAPDCCEEHRDEFKGELLRILDECSSALQTELGAAEDEGGDGHSRVH
jgi:restriction endonuclease Mrr